VDEDVPAEVAAFLAARGWAVALVRDRFGQGTPDYVVARGASEEAALVLTWNARHFLSLATRRTPAGAFRYPGMSLLAFTCSHPRGLARLRELIADIESVYQNRVVARPGRMIAVVGDTSLRFEDPEPSAPPLPPPR